VAAQRIRELLLVLMKSMERMPGKYYIRIYFVLFLVIAIAIICCPGCAIRSVYVPLSQNVPLFDSDKHVMASGFVGVNHVELQAAHNPIDNFAIATNIYFGAGISNYDVAIGTYGYNKNGTWRYELFGGYGYNSNIDFNGGNILSASQNVSYDVYSIYNRFYLQPTLGVFSKINMYKIRYSFSLSAKVSYLFFDDYIYQETNRALSTQTNPVYLINKEYQNKGIFTFEPCITNKVGIKNVSAILQFQTISPYSQQIDVRNTKFSPVAYFSIGIQYDFIFKVK
jgi:hypothetical protein